MRALLLATCCVLTFGGCKTFTNGDGFKLSNPFSKEEEKPEPYPNPVKMATTWTPDTLTTVGKTPTRGFGGRVFFYDEKSRPVPVDGELLIVGYEESDHPGEPPRVKRFGFTQDQFTEHYSQSDFGASYSFWIPWDADGGPQQRITLVPSFTSKAGNTVQGTPTAVLLPGPQEEDLAEAYSQASPSRRYSGPGTAPYVPPNGQYAPPNGQYIPPIGQNAAVQQTAYAGAHMTARMDNRRMQERGRPQPQRSGMTTTTIPIDPASNRNAGR